MSPFRLIAGVVILFFGRPLYWVMVAILGFVLGFNVMQELQLSVSPLMHGVIAVGAGLIAAVLAIGFQWLAFGLVGFLSGSYLVVAAFEQHQWNDEYESIWILAGGVIGAVLAVMIVDWAVIGLSAIAGATMIADEFSLGEPNRMGAIVILAIIGVIVQKARLDRKKRPSRAR